MIKRQNGYVLKKIKGTAYLLPYGQNIADQKRGLIFNETGEVIWNFLDKEKTLEEIIEAVAAYYEIPVSDREELGKDVEEFVSQLLGMGILKEELKKGKEPFYHCMKIGGICIKLCGPADIFPKQFASFFCEEEEADQIIVLDDGEIKAIGRHEELMQSSDIYREVYESQKKGGDDNE